MKVLAGGQLLLTYCCRRRKFVTRRRMWIVHETLDRCSITQNLNEERATSSIVIQIPHIYFENQHPGYLPRSLTSSKYSTQQTHITCVYSISFEISHEKCLVQFQKHHNYMPCVLQLYCRHNRHPANTSRFSRQEIKNPEIETLSWNRQLTITQWL